MQNNKLIFDCSLLFCRLYLMQVHQGLLSSVEAWFFANSAAVDQHSLLLRPLCCNDIILLLGWCCIERNHSVMIWLKRFSPSKENWEVIQIALNLFLNIFELYCWWLTALFAQWLSAAFCVTSRGFDPRGNKIFYVLQIACRCKFLYVNTVTIQGKS